VLNKVLLIGRLAGDPVIRYLPSGSPVAEFSVVWNRRYRTQEEWKEESHFFDIKAYGKLAEDLSSRLSKGYQVVIEGRLTQERWTGQDGKNYSRVRVVAEAVRIIRKPRIEEVEEEEIPTPEKIEEDLKAWDEEDELPF